MTNLLAAHASTFHIKFLQAKLVDQLESTVEIKY